LRGPAEDFDIDLAVLLLAQQPAGDAPSAVQTPPPGGYARLGDRARPVRLPDSGMW
jgi:hypothetical protein